MSWTSIHKGERNNSFARQRLAIGSFSTLICALIFAVSTWGQTGTGGINGVITDPQGKAVSRANVTLTNLGTNATRTATTTEAGLYVFDLLTPGDYRIEVEAAG